MDPIANLIEQRDLAARLLDSNYPHDAAVAIRLAELVQALDEWRRKGGADPYKSVIASMNSVARLKRARDLIDAVYEQCAAGSLEELHRALAAAKKKTKTGA